MPIFCGEHALLAKNENFNFFASQLRVRIKMAFGLMVKKWGILARPLTIKLKNVKRLVTAIAKLHNFCINKRLARNNTTESHQQGRVVFTPTNAALHCHEAMLREESAFEQFDEMDKGYESDGRTTATE